MKKKWKLRLTEALQASFWILEVARDEKEVFPRSGKKSPRKSKKGKEEIRDQLRALFSCLRRLLKYKLVTIITLVTGSHSYVYISS